MIALVKIFVHLFFWIVFAVLSLAMSFRSLLEADVNEFYLWAFGIACLWAITVFYFFYFVLYRYIARQQFVRYALYSLLSVGVFSGIVMYCLHRYMFTAEMQISFWWNISSFFGAYVIASCGSLIRGFLSWIESVHRHSELEKQNLRLELDALQAQVNPHFLFNTLNNIDALITSNPQKASQMLIMLSDVIRYMLYQTKEFKVSLRQEVQHVDNLIALQKIRFSHKHYVQFECDIQNDSYPIVPLLFVPFVENAFKYGAYQGVYPVVHIRIHQFDNQLLFYCANYYRGGQAACSPYSGVGLENVRKRLQLIYPNTHTLEIIEEHDMFEVNLTIT